MDKILKSSHQGTLDINGTKISCAVLENGTRVISERSVGDALGFKASSAYWKKKKEDKSGSMLPQYLAANNLTPYIDQKLLEKLSESITYVSKSGVISNGISADILPDICHVWINSKNNNALSAAQEKVAENAYILLRGFATVGIIALVDEATGYQHEREKDELQKILKAYIAAELLPWQKKFPDVFYKELFRLNGWEFTIHGIKKRPGVIGTWTNKLVYEQLPNGVLEELKNKTPKSSSGNFVARLHQNLTPNVGDEHLAAQLNQIITLFQLSDNMQHMWQQFNKLKLRQSGQLELPFSFDSQGHTVDPAPEPEKNISSFDASLKKALDFNPKENK